MFKTKERVSQGLGSGTKPGKGKQLLPVVLAGVLLLSGCGATQGAAGGKSSGGQTASGAKVTLPVYAAGTLAKPFKELDAKFQAKYPNVTVQPQFGGSVKMVKQVTDLKQLADVVAVADYSVIPKYMLGAGGQKKYADWYVGFASNAITFVYTDKSKGQDKITPDNWYKVLAQKGVQIGRSNPDTDPSGYQTLQMLDLAEKYYKAPGLEEKILANAPQTNMRDTETELLNALKTGQIDYLAIYQSDAKQNHLKYLKLPPQIDLSNPVYSKEYIGAAAKTKNGELTGKPIVYALTIPTNAPHAAWAEKYVAFLLGPEGQAILKKDGFGLLPKPYAKAMDKVPTDIKSLVEAWPQ
ncbi:tungstate ABC transporter binding protein WtpA [Acididesulfobacillus acetoxydans]|uniref:Molybdate/tungstate-binding protein WtpA n=1 Tax=Acididesulfobacillus acetoxydans TaxID=1561005 RepID=A0A8S0X4U6_9FIRM|nr:tungstate ABC transporter substrate-binding protein WtpA [Acididesulfobacillus acetoxydans]CAA7601090.1 tungstate ABC transporter binding protein WtpA [Acididesulfobacillus acetoxydans]CEJ06964.1 Molybdate/tungstate-binding protein WtpA [Acididesulfobacillus acetoxydans]